MSPDRIEASAESVPGGRSGEPTAALRDLHRVHGEAGACIREAREREAGA